MAALKSSRNTRIQAILDALSEAHEEAREQCKCSLNRMPEYYMVTRVADYFVKHFANFGYRLEAPVRHTLEQANRTEGEIKELLDVKELRSNGRFDLVLHTTRRGKPAHIIEFKRGVKIGSLASDINRLAMVCDSVKESSRLETNYLVAVTKRTSDNWEEKLNSELFDQIQHDKLANAIHPLQVVSKKLGPTMSARFEDQDKKFTVLVIEVRSKY